MTTPPDVTFPRSNIGMTAGRRSRRSPGTRAIYLVTVLAYAMIFTFWQVEPLPGEVHALGVLIFATSLIPLAVWTTRGRRNLPMFELIVMSYALQYSMPLYTQSRGLIISSQFVPVSWQALTQVLILVEIGLIAFIAGYYLFLRGPLAAKAPQVDLPFSEQGRMTYIYFSFILGGAVMALSAAGVGLLQAPALGAVIRLLASQFNIALIVLAYRVYEQARAPRGQRILLYAALTFAFLIGLSTGLIENAFIPVVSVFVVRWQARRRLPWQWLVAAAMLFVVLNPAKFAFRSLVWFGGANYSLGDRIGLWSDLAAESAGNLLQPTFASDRETAVLGALSRFDLVHKFAYVHTMTPQVVPYYQGSTYAYFLVAWVPRAIWPDKPTATGGANERMDVDYQLKFEGQATSIGIGLLPEAFANFGAIGVILIMMLQGAVLALLSAMFDSKSSDGGRAIYLSVGVYLLNGIGTSASVMFGAIFQQVLASAVILRPFAAGWRAAPKVASPESICQSDAPSLPR